MKNRFLAVIVLSLGLTSCQQEGKDIQPTTPPPVANFSVQGDLINNVITIGTFDELQTINKSMNADTYLWSFGDGNASNLESPVLSYVKPGTYTLTLTAQAEDGRKTSMSKTVKILDRVIKQVVIRDLLNYHSIASLSLNQPKVWVEIKLGANNTQYPRPNSSNSSFDAPIIYKSPVISNFGPGNIPYTLNVPGNIILNFPALTAIYGTGLGYSGVGYGLELYAQDDSGTYLLSTSYEYFLSSQSGAISWPVADVQKNIFIARYANIDVICSYE